MTGASSGEEGGALAQSSRWLVFSLGDRRAAVPLEYMVRILERAEIFPLPVGGREFKGVIYYNDMAVPVLQWKFLLGREIAGANILIVEYGNDLLGMEIGELAKVEERKDVMLSDGFWTDMDPGKGLYALNVDKVFQALRKGGSTAGLGR